MKISTLSANQQPTPKINKRPQLALDAAFKRTGPEDRVAVVLRQQLDRRLAVVHREDQQLQLLANVGQRAHRAREGLELRLADLEGEEGLGHDLSSLL